MIIRKYGTTPPTYTADVGELILARLSNSDPWALAVVLMARRRKGRVIRYEIMWMETQEHTTAVKGEYSHVYQRPGGPELVRFLPVKRKSARPPSAS